MSKNILIADDDPVMLKLYARIFSAKLGRFYQILKSSPAPIVCPRPLNYVENSF